MLTSVIPVTKIKRFEDTFVTMLRKVQGLPVFLIIVHDIQDFETSEILKLLLKQIPENQFLLLEGQYGSPGAARNVGLQHVKTDWIAFWDADDLPNPSAFLEMEKFGSARNLDLVVGNILVSRLNSIDKKRHSVNTFATHSDLFSTLPAFTRILYRFEFIKYLEFPEIKFGEDLCFLMSTLALSPMIGSLDIDTYEYIIYPEGQQTSADGIVENTSLAIKTLDKLSCENWEFGLMVTVIKLRMIASAFKKSWKGYEFYVSPLPRILILKAFQNPEYFAKALFVLIFRRTPLI